LSSLLNEMTTFSLTPRELFISATLSSFLPGFFAAATLRALFFIFMDFLLSSGDPPFCVPFFCMFGPLRSAVKETLPGAPLNESAPR